MSVALTEQAVRERRKTVTRRLGWVNTRQGEPLTLCRKVMGRRRGDTVEPLIRIAEVEVVDVRREALHAITRADVAAEGFAGWSVEEFLDFFTSHMRCTRDTIVTRIEWRYLLPDLPEDTR